MPGNAPILPLQVDEPQISGGAVRSGAQIRTRIIFAFITAFVASVLLQGCSRKPNSATPDGAALFVQRCAGCHSPGNDMRAPQPAALPLMSQRFTLAALTSRRMKFEAKGLTNAQKLAME